MAKTTTKTKIEGNPFIPRLLDFSNKKLFFEKIKIKECRFCSTPFQQHLMFHYPHDSGYKVPGFLKKQWLYLSCSKCRHNWALTHLGVSKEKVLLEFYNGNIPKDDDLRIFDGSIPQEDFLGTKWDLQMQVKHEQDKIWEIQDLIETRLMKLAQHDPYWNIDSIPEEMAKRMPEINNLNKILEIIKRK